MTFPPEHITKYVAARDLQGAKESAEKGQFHSQPPLAPHLKVFEVDVVIECVEVRSLR